MNIGIDIDDTISETYEMLFGYAQKYTIEDLGKSGEIQRIETPTHHVIEVMHKWDKGEFDKFFEKYYAEFLEKVNIKPFAKDVIQKLSENNKIILITARWELKNTNVTEITKEWLKRNEVPYDKIITDAQDKASIAKENSIDLFIDDSFENCKKVSDNGIKSFVMETRTNTKYNDERITRVYSWPHIYQEYKKLIND